MSLYDYRLVLVRLPACPYIDYRPVLTLTTGLSLYDYRPVLLRLPACPCTTTGLSLHRLPACPFTTTGLSLHRLPVCPRTTTGLSFHRLPACSCMTTGLSLHRLSVCPFIDYRPVLVAATGLNKRPVLELTIGLSLQRSPTTLGTFSLLFRKHLFRPRVLPLDLV